MEVFALLLSARLLGPLHAALALLQPLHAGQLQRISGSAI
jgi:hypothetical protein